MRILESEAVVSEDGTMSVSVKVPPEVVPGPHRITIAIEEGARLAETSGTRGECCPLAGLHTFRWSGAAAGQTFRREDMYGDDGR
jgi:hypothetical protein